MMMRVFVQTVVCSFSFLCVFTICISNLSKSLSRKNHGKKNPPGLLTSRIFREMDSWSCSSEGIFGLWLVYDDLTDVIRVTVSTGEQRNSRLRGTEEQ